MATEEEAIEPLRPVLGNLFHGMCIEVLRMKYSVVKSCTPEYRVPK